MTETASAPPATSPAHRHVERTVESGAEPFAQQTNAHLRSVGSAMNAVAEKVDVVKEGFLKLTAALQPSNSTALTYEKLLETLNGNNANCFSVMTAYNCDRERQVFNDAFLPNDITLHDGSLVHDVKEAFTSVLSGDFSLAFIESPAGGGKSTVASWLALNFQTLGLNIDAVIYVNLFVLDGRCSSDQHCSNWARCLLERGVCDPGVHPIFTPAEAEDAASLLDANRDRVVYVFDGYDEVQNTNNSALRNLLHRLHTVSGNRSQLPFVSKVIVTTRSHFSENFSGFYGAPCKAFCGYQQIILHPWSLDVAQRYVDKFLTRENHKQLLHKFLHRHFARFTLYPYVVHLLCCATEKNYNKLSASPADQLFIFAEFVAVFTVAKKACERDRSCRSFAEFLKDVAPVFNGVEKIVNFNDVCVYADDDDDVNHHVSCGFFCLTPTGLNFMHSAVHNYFYSRQVFATLNNTAIKAQPLRFTEKLLKTVDNGVSDLLRGVGRLFRPSLVHESTVVDFVAKRLCDTVLERLDKVQLGRDTADFRATASSEAGIRAALHFFDAATSYPTGKKLIDDDAPVTTFLTRVNEATSARKELALQLLFNAAVEQNGAVHILNQLLTMVAPDAQAIGLLHAAYEATLHQRWDVLNWISSVDGLCIVTLDVAMTLKYAGVVDYLMDLAFPIVRVCRVDHPAAVVRPQLDHVISWLNNNIGDPEKLVWYEKIFDHLDRFFDASRRRAKHYGEGVLKRLARQGERVRVRRSATQERVADGINFSSDLCETSISEMFFAMSVLP